MTNMNWYNFICFSLFTEITKIYIGIFYNLWALATPDIYNIEVHGTQYEDIQYDYYRSDAYVNCKITLIINGALKVPYGCKKISWYSQ